MLMDGNNVHYSLLMNDYKSALASCKLSLVDFYLFVFLQKVNLENSISHKDTLFIYLSFCKSWNSCKFYLYCKFRK